MSKFTPKVPLAHTLPTFPAVLSLARTHPRFGLRWFAKRTGFTLGVLTRRCSGLPCAITELQR